MRALVVSGVGLTAVAVGLASAVLLIGPPAPPTTPPDYSGARPEVGTDGFVRHTEEIDIDMPIEKYAAWAANAALESQLRGTSRLPGVARTEPIQGTWGQPGARRRVVLEDGHQVVEEILEVDPPSLFRYEVWGFTNYGRYITDYAVGEFHVREVSGTTHVTWTYSFHKRSWITGLYLSNFVRTDWAEFMRTTLLTNKQAAEQSLHSQAP